MEWIEITGDSVEEAQDRALEVLGVDRGDAEFEVLSEAKTGLFGRVKAQARVRARVRPAAPRPKDDGGRRRRKPGRERPERAERSPKAEKAERPAETEDDGGSDEERRPRRRSGGNRRSRPVSSEENSPQGDKMEDVALSEQSALAKDFLGGLLQTAGASGSIDVRIDEDEELVFLDVQGENLGHLIGPRGATLQSVQELTRTVVQRKTGARNGRILVDISSYREKRREALERFTRQQAEEVKASGETRALEPMSPPDRKVVHDTINTIDGVTTTSEGEEPRRRVVIQPEA